MTVAVCWKCGEMKRGAFNPCPKCKAAPRSEDDLAVSLAMSDHYFDKPKLELMGADIAAGKPLQLAPETRRNLIKVLRDGAAVLPMFKDAPRAADIDYESPPPPKKSWWKKLF